MNLKMWGVLLTLGGFLGAQALPDDPVMKARSQRAQAQGIDEADLPPVPRAILEPPALPPPETHAKDLPHPRVTKADQALEARLRTFQVGGGPVTSHLIAAYPRQRKGRR